jgi:uncharacterized membrane protein (DUF4010 family)
MAGIVGHVVATWPQAEQETRMQVLQQDAPGLGAALGIGLLIGLQRGWQERDLPEGSRVAGLRTFALTGLLGGVLGVLLPRYGAWPLVAGLLSVALLLAVSYWQTASAQKNLSATGAIATLLTLVLGAFAASTSIALAFAAAVIAAVLLDLKPTLHGWLRLIQQSELSAALQLLVLSVVILPNLPNESYGPYDALNPFELWWAVILIAGLSLSGHFAIRLTGSQRGILWTGLLGGLASSTATTLALARHARGQPELAGTAAAGSLAACGVMFFRMAVLIGVIQPALLRTMGLTLIVSGVVLLVLGLRQWRRTGSQSGGEGPATMASPFGLGTALGFGLFLALMSVLVPSAKEWLGDSGIYVLSAISGLADVDAIVISLARQQGEGALPAATTAVALGLAALSNSVVKASIAWSAGDATMGRQVTTGLGLSLLAGAAAAWVSLALG